MLNKESEAISGDYPNERGGEEARIKNPDTYKGIGGK